MRVLLHALPGLHCNLAAELVQCYNSYKHILYKEYPPNRHDLSCDRTFVSKELRVMADW